MKMKYIFVAISVLVIIFATSSQIKACSCSWNPNPPCRAYGQADLIFDGIVLAVDRVRTNTNFPLRRRAKIKVLRSYKGNSESLVYVYTGDGRSDCGFKFNKGTRYLIYANSYEGFITTSKCGRNTEFKAAKEELAYLTSWSSLPTGINIYGKVEKNVFDSKTGFHGFPKVQIQIDGPELIKLETDKDGSFSRSGLQAGNYSVRAIVPAGFMLSTATMNDYFPLPLFQEQIPNKGCLEARFILEAEKSG